MLVIFWCTGIMCFVYDIPAFCRFLISFLEKNATKEILAVIGLKKPPSLSKKSQGKRYYTTTTPSAGEYTMYVELKKSEWLKKPAK